MAMDPNVLAPGDVVYFRRTYGMGNSTLGAEDIERMRVISVERNLEGDVVSAMVLISTRTERRDGLQLSRYLGDAELPGGLSEVLSAGIVQQDFED